MNWYKFLKTAIIRNMPYPTLINPYKDELVDFLRGQGKRVLSLTKKGSTFTFSTLLMELMRKSR